MTTVRLVEAIQGAARRGFAWGENDCALFAADCVKAQTGHDFGAPFRGKYGSPLGALRAVRRIGGAPDLAALATKHLGPPKSGPAATGDVVAARNTDGALVLGVAAGGWAYFLAEDGLRRVPADEVEIVWSVR